ncbi:MAG: AMP-binding protein [Desulfuromonadaceae bacterium]|nr:AMP-binding protein [Desulfuromonadaceae bacterium]
MSLVIDRHNNSLIHAGQYNIGHICTRQQCDAGRSDRVAMRWIAPALDTTDITFRELEQQTNRFANAISALGLEKGDVLFTFLPKMREQIFAFLGSLKMQLVTGTLFANFGEEALLDRLGDSQAKAIVTKKSFLKKLMRIRDRLPDLTIIILVDDESRTGEEGLYSYQRLVASASDTYETPLTSRETPSVLHYTSGSTGKPKGVVHVHGSVLHQSATTRDVLGLVADDIYWCTADQGWVTGTSYGIIGPWSLGVTQIHFAGGYDPEKWLQVVQDNAVTVWYSAPTALRMLMREEDALYRRYNLDRLRSIFSVGEPLNPEVINWAQRVLQRDIYDTWFQTETGGIMISNRPDLKVCPGSMGQPVAGIEAAILDDRGVPVPFGEQGNLCLKVGWPSMFVTYINNAEIYDQKFREGYYYTGDTASCDDDGYYWFMGRSDDVINTGGHLISPFEVESALLEIAEIAESGVVGVPDEVLFEAVVVFVSLHKGIEATDELEMKIRLYLANRVSSIATPRQVLFCNTIPKNKSGKIMRRVLRARFLGQDEGDLSTLED